MVRWRRRLSTVGDERVLLAVGALNVLLAVDQLSLGVRAAEPFGEVLTNAALIGGAGAALLYWGATLPRTDLDSAVYPRIAGWVVGAPVLLLLAVAFLGLNSGPIGPSREVAEIAVAIGSVGGYAIGENEARAVMRAREAERHQRELRRQNERLDSFAGLLAHELRNPLQIAQMYHPNERPRDEEAAEHVQNAIDRIEEMIDVLLVTVRGSEVTVDSRPVALADVAAEAWADLSERTAAADLVVETELVIRADPVHVEHLLRNLFRNSLEHGGEGATVRVGDLPAVSATDAGGGFYVEDDGPGIPEDIRVEVAEAGFTTKDGGIGLGLTFVNHLAEMYDWELTITDGDAGGARFEFAGVALAPGERRRD